MSVWKRPIDPAAFNERSKGTASDVLGIRVTEVGDDYIRGEMDVTRRTHQPMGLLHGGVSCVLAETLGSIAGLLTCDEGYTVVGVDINATHMRGVRSGKVIATARPLKLGRRMQFWSIDIETEDGKAVCASRLTVAVVPIDAENPKA